MAIKYSCDNCGKETQEIVSNKEEYGMEFCNDCLKTYQGEKDRVEKQHKKELGEALVKIDRKFGIQKEGILSKLKG